MRILSLNVWGGKLYDALMPYLLAAAPDVLCLQEVVRTPAVPVPWLTYRDGETILPQRTNLFDEIRALFPEHDAIFAPAAGGLLHGEDGTSFPSQFGLATLVHRSFSIIGQSLDFVHGRFSDEDWGAHPRPRNAHCLRLVDQRDGGTLTIAQMHGLRDPAGKHDTPARTAQAKALVRLIERTRQKDDRLVVCGDFNVLPSSITFEALGELGLRDLVTERGHADTRTSHYQKTPRFADYLLVTPQVDVVDFQVVAEPEVSDHRALVLDMR
ncbi:endonuclease/exonuclease/phosphatase family protein [Nitratireductor sp. ZSWI3]|uniref:endonuclease/exonuclease/phosphatase family protein n=1 Tax=Nitratireductor sp. ZSWI3 TaxID=2966359 RepID=UPI002150607F|nr:endonuclease/exonuclease/phosphatase family protein [Nitratireductor sp. ZSWI3]MCR4269118.1 endonuclease/exonuclease/phosphatase family protein [Nitratireductor sp. ZSWI3]